MHYVDGIFVLVFCVFLFFGVKGGTKRGAVAVLSIVIGLVLATHSMHGLAEFLNRIWSLHEAVGAVLGFVIVFVGVIVAQVLVVALLNRGSDPPRLGSRIFGGAFGLVEGAIYISIILILLNLYSVPSLNVRNKSLLYRPLRDFAPLVFDTTNSLFAGSTSFYEELRKSFEKFRFIRID